MTVPATLVAAVSGEIGSVAIFGAVDAALLQAVAPKAVRIFLIAVDPKGTFSNTAFAQGEAAKAQLVTMGFAPTRISVITKARDLTPVDLVLNFGAFGNGWRVTPLAVLLPPLLNGQTQMLCDIRKGSGTFPLLRNFGQTRVIESAEVTGKPLAFVHFQAHPTTEAKSVPEVELRDDGWSDIAKSLAGSGGFFRESPDHSFLYIQRGDTLVVTFDNLDIAMTKREDRRPWGFSFIEKQGWSMLGVMANGWTWYRDPWVWQEFDTLREAGFFKPFKRVVFYGASMGGYAAAAFVAACPGADVVAISPQSSLDKTLVPWETRYQTAWGRDFSGPYGDAAQVSQAAGRVFILYDPYEPLDSGHVARFEGDNVTKLRTPLLGHRLGSSLQQMGILAPITLAALNGTLTEAEFYATLRARKQFGRYQRELFKRALDRGRPELARRIGRWVLTRGGNRYIRQAMAKL